MDEEIVEEKEKIRVEQLWEDASNWWLELYDDSKMDIIVAKYMEHAELTDEDIDW